MRVLILSSSTGGGHDMRARAFRAWTLQSPQAPITARIHQTLEETHPIYGFGVRLYNWIQRSAPYLHHLYFNFLEAAGLFKSASKILAAERFQNLLEEIRPDVLLSVHGSLNHGFFELARRALGRNVSCVTYCGELSGGYGFSRHWVNPSADLFLGAVPETCEAAAAMGMPRGKTRAHGFLLDPSFYSPPLCESEKHRFIHEELHLDPDSWILLLSASAMGAQNHLPFLKALRRLKRPIQVVALCGRSEGEIHRVRQWAKRDGSFPVRALPFSSQMSILLQCASAVVARPGTGTTSEAIVSECPILFNGLGGVMPQERLTIKYGRKYQIAEVLHHPEDLPRTISHMQKSNRLAELRATIKKARPASHPREILQSIFELGART